MTDDLEKIMKKASAAHRKMGRAVQARADGDGIAKGEWTWLDVYLRQLAEANAQIDWLISQLRDKAGEERS